MKPASIAVRIFNNNNNKQNLNSMADSTARIFTPMEG